MSVSNNRYKQPMPFSGYTGFDLGDEKEKREPSRLELAVRKLHAHLVEKRRIKRQASVGKWLRDVRKLVLDEDATPDEVIEVIGWYCDHSEDDYMPQVFSTTTFVEKWNKLVVKKRQTDKGQSGDILDEIERRRKG